MVSEKDNPVKPERKVNIQIDREHFTIDELQSTGGELRTLPDPDVPANRDLFLVVPGGQDIKIEVDTPVTLKSGMRFFTAPGQINPGALHCQRGRVASKAA